MYRVSTKKTNKEQEMKAKKFVATLDQVGEVIRRVDLSRLENRLVGKSLIELEHCLIEIIGYLDDSLRFYNREAIDYERRCIEAINKDQFFSIYREFKKEQLSFGSDHGLASSIGYYFQALLDKLTAVEEKQVQAGKKVTVSHARMLSLFLFQQIERMWKASQSSSQKIDQLWEHWIKQ
jgi:hypothetical protein